MKRAHTASAERIREDSATMPRKLSIARKGNAGKCISKGPGSAGKYNLSRREIIEELMRQGLNSLSRIKSECRRFEEFWEAREEGSTL
jgi:hypothetical protein